MSNPRIKHTGNITKTDDIDGIGDFMRAVWQDFKVENRGLFSTTPRQERGARLSQDLQKIKDMSDAECDQAAKAEFKNERRKLRARITRHTNIYNRLLNAERALEAFSVESNNEKVRDQLLRYKKSMAKYLQTRKSWSEDDIRDARRELDKLRQETGAQWCERKINDIKFILERTDCLPKVEEVAAQEKAFDADVEKRIAHTLILITLERNLTP